MFGINDLLLNFAVIVLPIFIYQVFWTDRQQEKGNPIWFTILMAIATILCMSFPVILTAGYNIDLRMIPFLLGLMFGGYRAAILITLTTIAYRFYIGGSGFLPAVMISLGTFLAACLLLPLYNRLERRGRTLLLCGFSFVVACVVLFNTWHRNMQFNHHIDDFIPISIVFCLIYVVSMWVAVSLVENGRDAVRMRKEVQRAEQLHVLGELAASIAHEIRNPMTVSRGFVQMMIEQDVPEEKRHTYLQLVIHELDRAQTIINDYLSLAKPQQEKLVRLHMKDHLLHVTNVISSFALLRNVEVESELAEDLHVVANSEKLSQVLLNMIKNGIEAMPDGGTMRLVLSREQDQVLVRIIDQGVGMTAEQMDRLGNPFYSTKDTGTGLGLMVCYRIIQNHGGRIEVSSQPGVGTEFSIYLPLAS